MVLRTFPAFDNEAFTVDPSSPSLTTGSALINNSSTPIGTVFAFTSGFPYQTITLDDQDGGPNSDVFNDNDPSDHIITDGGSLVANGTQVESESYHFFRALDADGDPTGPIITVTVFSKDGDFEDIWGMASDTELQDGVRYVKVGGSNNGDSLYSTFVPCFTKGTRIMTPKGETPIEQLRTGDLVLTRDNGMKPIVWIGRRDLTKADVLSEPRLAPIHIQAGALPHLAADRDLVVSPNHRLLMNGASVQMAFGETEVFAAAKHLLKRPGIHRRKGDVSYFHMLFDRHEVVLSNGIWSESFCPGPVALQGLAKAQSSELFALFPDLRTGTTTGVFTPARAVLNGTEARLFAG